MLDLPSPLELDAALEVLDVGLEAVGGNDDAGGVERAPRLQGAKVHLLKDMSLLNLAGHFMKLWTTCPWQTASQFELNPILEDIILIHGQKMGKNYSNSYMLCSYSLEDLQNFMASNEGNTEGSTISEERP